MKMFVKSVLVAAIAMAPTLLSGQGSSSDPSQPSPTKLPKKLEGQEAGLGAKLKESQKRSDELLDEGQDTKDRDEGEAKTPPTIQKLVMERNRHLSRVEMLNTLETIGREFQDSVILTQATKLREAETVRFQQVVAEFEKVFGKKAVEALTKEPPKRSNPQRTGLPVPAKADAKKSEEKATGTGPKGALDKTAKNRGKPDGSRR